MTDKPMIFISPIKKKIAITKGYHEYSHKCGILLLEKAFRHTGLVFSEKDIIKTKSGKPYIKNNPVYFSISHCDGLAVCVLSEDEIGVDCESIRRASNAVMKRCYGDSEKQNVINSPDSDTTFSRLWTLKESYVKMTGDGIASDLKTKCFDIKNSRTLFESGAVFYHYNCQFDDNDYFISVCLRTDNKITAETIQVTDFDIDNEHILLYNVSDN